MFGGGIGTQDGGRDIARDRADIDQRTAALAQMFERFQRAVHHTPVIGLEQLVMIVVAELFELGVHANTGIVDPSVEPAVASCHGLNDISHVVPKTDVTDHVIGSASFATDGVTHGFEGLGAAGHQDHPGAVTGSIAGYGETDAGAASGNNNGLL